jgi:hypothetical protein
VPKAEDDKAPADTEGPGEGGKEATKGNESPSKVAGGGVVADNLKQPEDQESPTPTEADLDALDAQEKLALEDAERAKALAKSVKADQAPIEPDYHSALDKFAKIIEVGHPDTPDSYVCWGLGGVKITMGDVRAIGRVYVDMKTAFDEFQKRKASGE